MPRVFALLSIVCLLAVGGGVAFASGGNGTITFDGTFSPTDPGAGPHWTQVYGSAFSYIAANQEQLNPVGNPKGDGHYRVDICNSSSSSACDATSSHYTYAKATAYCTSIPFYLPRALPRASGNQWYQIAEMKKSVEPGGGNWTIGIGGSGIPRLAFGFTGGAYNNTDAYRGAAPSTGVWHTASVCQNAGGTSSYAFYDGVRITYNVGSCSGKTTCTGLAMFGPCACSYLPLDINAYTGNTSGTDTWKGYAVIHGDPLVATIGSNGLPPEPPGGWNSP